MEQGIRKNEKIFCITDSCPPGEILGYFKRFGKFDAQKALDIGQLHLLDFKEAYLHGGEFDAQRIFDLIQRASRQSLREGYSGVLVTSEMSKMLYEIIGPERLVDYEARANLYIRESACTAICHYDRRRFESRLILDLFSLHPYVAADRWIYENRYFLTPEEYQERGLHETILERMIGNLESSRVLEQQLSKEREFSQDLLQSMPAYFVAIDGEGRTVFANKTMLHKLGYTLEEVKGRDYLSTFVPPEEHAAVAEELRLLSVSESPRMSINRVLSKDGRKLTVEWCGKRMLSEDGSLEFLFGIGLDISERIGMQEAIREREEIFDLVASSAKDAIVILNGEGRVCYWNPAAEEIFGYTAEEMMGKDLHLLLAPKKYHASYREGISRFRATGSGSVIGKTLELEGRRRDGATFPFELSVSSFQRRGEWHAVGILRDITERKSREKALQESEQKYRTVFETTGTAMFIIGSDGTVSDVNRMAERMLGWAREEVVEKAKYTDFLHPDDVGKAVEYSSRLWRGETSGPIQFEARVKRCSGEFMPTLATINLLPGREAGIVSLIDISREKDRERILEEKAKQLKDFLAIASHELRHPLTLVKGYAAILEKNRHSLDAEDYDHALQGIRHGVNRLTRIVESLLDITRIEHGTYLAKRRPTDLRLLVEGVAEEVRMKEYREITLDLRGELENVYVDPEAISQLFVILLENACKFSPPSTVVEVRGEGKEGMVRFSVLDRGIGVPDEDRERIFELFYQVEDVIHHSKPGLGIGLYMARKIVEAHGGRIWHTNREDVGSEFSFEIPGKPQGSPDS